jgi:sugar/nucleoside kinase (ribokinase family)
VFTAGAEPIVYGTAGVAPRRLDPFRADVKGTLGAGDAFRAGLVYGVHQNWNEDRAVTFAAALAAEVCTRFPVAADPPSLADVERRVQSRS